MARNRSYSNPTKAAAVATAVVTGSPAMAAAAAGIPRRTVADWLQQWKSGELGDAEFEQQVADLIEEFDQAALATMAAVVAKGLALLEKGIDAWTAKADQLTPTGMKDIGLVVAIIADKRQLIEGRPTSLSVRLSHSVIETDPLADDPLAD